MQRSSILVLMLALACVAGAAFAQQRPSPAPAQPQAQPTQSPQPAQSQPTPRQAQPMQPQPMQLQPMQPQPMQPQPMQPASPQGARPPAGPLPQGAQSANGLAAQARDDIKSMFGFVPRFLSDLPDNALPGAWEEMKGLQMNPNTALPPKVKELIGLAVAAQVPCTYCTYAHTEFAKLDGATPEEIEEAVVVGAQTRHWSTITQGSQQDLAAFKRELQGTVARMKQVLKGEAPAPQPLQVTDAASALQDIERHFGIVPEFMRRVPPEALPGAWREMRDVMMNPNTAISMKHKRLIGIGVASQIPCRYCLAAGNEFARQLEGATDREIDEAIAMAALTRHWSTWLNGMRTDEAQFKRDIDRVVRTVQKQMPTAQRRDAAAPAVARGPVQPAKPATAPSKPTPGGGAAAKQSP